MGTLPDIPVSRLGGHLAIDFLNTVDWRLDPERRSERLAAMPHVLAWAASVELVTPAEAHRLLDLAEENPHASAAEHADVLAVRESGYAAFTEHVTPDSLLDRVQRAARRFTLVYGAAWRWDSPELTLHTPGDRIARALLDLLRDPSSASVRRCDDNLCGWLFVDTSRGHNRRWCSSAGCGNRNRVKQHYQRAAKPSRS